MIVILKAFLFYFRLKQLKDEPYTQAEAERAAGMGSYIPAKTVEVHTQQVEEDMDWKRTLVCLCGLLLFWTQSNNLTCFRAEINLWR